MLQALTIGVCLGQVKAKTRNCAPAIKGAAQSVPNSGSIATFEPAASPPLSERDIWNETVPPNFPGLEGSERVEPTNTIDALAYRSASVVGAHPHANALPETAARNAKSNGRFIDADASAERPLLLERTVSADARS